MQAIRANAAGQGLTSTMASRNLTPSMTPAPQGRGGPGAHGPMSYAQTPATGVTRGALSNANTTKGPTPPSPSAQAGGGGEAAAAGGDKGSKGLFGGLFSALMKKGGGSERSAAEPPKSSGPPPSQGLLSQSKPTGRSLQPPKQSTSLLFHEPPPFTPLTPMATHTPIGGGKGGPEAGEAIEELKAQVSWRGVQAKRLLC